MGTHECLTHILARRGCSVPVNDGRKIALILHGGLMAGVRGAGAMIALHELGLAHAFDLILCNSAGFANASYLLADDAYNGASIYYWDLAGNKFINFRHISNVVNMDYVLHVVRFLKPLDVMKIPRPGSDLRVALYNQEVGQLEYRANGSCTVEEHLTLLRASITMPLFDRRATLINGFRYQDPRPWWHRLRHVRASLNAGCTDILVIYNRCQQSSVERIPSGTPVFAIAPDPQWRLSRFETKPDVLRYACSQMGRHVKQTFGFDANIQLL